MQLGKPGPLLRFCMLRSVGSLIFRFSRVLRASRAGAALLCALSVGAAQQPFTLQQVLSAPYSSELTVAPQTDTVAKEHLNLFAWVENREGRRDLFVGGPGTPAYSLTHDTTDDGQDITDIAWAPDASSLAYTVGPVPGEEEAGANPAHLQRSTQREVVVQSLAPGAAPRVVGEGHAPIFSPDGRSVLFVRGGQIWSAGLSPAEPPRQLVYDRGSARGLTISPDGSLLAFVSVRGERNEPDHSFIGLFHLQTRTLEFLSPSTQNDSAPVFSPDGHSIAWLRTRFQDPPEFAADRVSSNPWSVQIASVCASPDCGAAAGTSASAARTVYAPGRNQPGSVLPRLADGQPRLFFVPGQPSPKLVFYSEADGWTHLYEADTHSGNPPRLLTPGSFEVQDASESCANSHAQANCSIFYASNQAGADPLDSDRRHIYRLDFAGPEPHGGVPAPQQLTAGSTISVHPEGSATGFAALESDSRTPAHVVFTPLLPDGTAGHGQALEADALPPGYPQAALVVPQQILLAAADGLRLHAQLFLPPGSAHARVRRPALLFLHGGPRRQMLLGFPPLEYYSDAYAMNQYLASRGFVVLSVNYRCGIGYGVAFRQCEHSGPAGAAEYNDVLAGVHYLRGRADVDPQRIGLWGGSYGGYLTELGLARNSDLFAAGVSFHGIYDWNLEQNADEWKQGSYAQRDAIAALARASSPIGAIDRWRSPVLLIHGDDDPAVAYAQTPLLSAALRARGVPVQELIFPDEVHDLVLHSTWLAAYQAAAQFFEQVLKP